MAFGLMQRKKTYNRDRVVQSCDLMHHVFKHLDPQSLAVAACVCRVWRKEAMSDNVWELVCTKHWPDTGNPIKRLGSVVNAMGGFRHLYMNYLRPILSGKGKCGCNLKSYSSRPASASNNRNSDMNVVWGEDQVQLSLSLFSVEYYRRLGFFKSSYTYISGPSSSFTLPIQTLMGKFKPKLPNKRKTVEQYLAHGLCRLKL